MLSQILHSKSNGVCYQLLFDSLSIKVPDYSCIRNCFFNIERCRTLHTMAPPSSDLSLMVVDASPVIHRAAGLHTCLTDIHRLHCSRSKRHQWPLVKDERHPQSIQRRSWNNPTLYVHVHRRTVQSLYMDSTRTSAKLAKMTTCEEDTAKT